LEAAELRVLRAGCVLLVALTAGACASSSALACRPGERPAVMESLYFGTAKAGGSVTRAEWSEFVNQVVTPRFPQGLTSWEATGQWQHANGMIESETSHVLHLVHPDTEKSETAINEVVNKYKEQFQQEAVLRVRSKACVSF
jgi:hypothetical protein